jgi:hypothetical protein
LRRFWLGFLKVPRGAGGGARYRACHVRALADLLAFPTGRTDILCGAAGIAAQDHPARDEEQKYRGSKHGFSLTAILYANVRRKETQEGLAEQAVFVPGQYSDQEAEGKDGI